MIKFQSAMFFRGVYYSTYLSFAVFLHLFVEEEDSLYNIFRSKATNEKIIIKECLDVR